MAKQKKKRNKVYRGAGASVTRPIVTKINAANRGPVKQWWFEKKRIMKPLLITGGVLVAVILLVIEIIQLIVGR